MSDGVYERVKGMPYEQAMPVLIGQFQELADFLVEKGIEPRLVCEAAIAGGVRVNLIRRGDDPTISLLVQTVKALVISGIDDPDLQETIARRLDNAFSRPLMK